MARAFRPGAYRLEIISAGLLGSGKVQRVKMNKDHQALVDDDWKHVTLVMNSPGVDC